MGEIECVFERAREEKSVCVREREREREERRVSVCAEAARKGDEAAPPAEGAAPEREGSLFASYWSESTSLSR